MKKETTILCIDDDREITHALELLFQFQGWRGISVGSVECGLKAFQANQPDIVLIDYHMPQINGVEGVRLLRRLSATVPIIVFTIDESQAVADEFLMAGASDFALKPIKAPDIISRIKLHLKLLEAAQPEHPAPPLAKGIGRSTLELIEGCLARQSDLVTVNDIAEETNLAYQTVYRYLQYMVQEMGVEVVNIYGKVGRPKQMYRMKNRR